MIFKISKEFAASMSSDKWCEVFPIFMRHQHFILSDYDTLTVIKEKLKEGGPYLERKFKDFTANSGFRPTRELQTYLTTIDVTPGFCEDEFVILSEMPGYLICENNNYEWDIYRHFMNIYSKGTKLKNVFSFLDKAAERNVIKAYSCGGNGQLIPSYETLRKEFPKFSLLHKKCCFLFDRDTPDDLSFSSTNKSLFQFLNDGKDHVSSYVSQNDDIYCLTQKGFVWHTWYKRAIENYFPIDKFSAFKVAVPNLAAPSDWDYCHVDEKNCRGYRKADLHKIAWTVGKDDLENTTKKFRTIGGEYSEIQLFLLKLVKIV